MPFPMRYLHIYSFWVSSYPRAKILHDIVETALFRQCILSVSTYWRYMALSIPRLWQSVDLKPHVPASHLPFALLHSRTMPLSITISDCCPCCGDAPPEDQATLWTPDILRATLEVLTPHAARWSSLSFMLRDHSLVGLLAMHVDPALPLPELRTQQLWVPCPPGSRVEWDTFHPDSILQIPPPCLLCAVAAASSIRASPCRPRIQLPESQM